MISYGELIRQIRQSKKISQKEVYTGVISKSYAIEFEKGTHAISSLLLEKIVAKLMVSMEEFFLMYHQEELPEKEDFGKLTRGHVKRMKPPLGNHFTGKYR